MWMSMFQDLKYKNSPHGNLLLRSPSTIAMASTFTNYEAAAASLPQYGFGADVDFDSLVVDNHFLFRVYTPKAPSPFADDSEPFFVAPKFNERFTRSPEEIKAPYIGRDSQPTHIGTYDDVARHMDWTTKASSPYISTSFSFIWSIWEALRRYHLGIKKDVEIAVIDASALTDRAVTAVQLLRNGLPAERRSEHWKWYRFAQESQSVLVYECIPASAVFTSIPLLSLLEKLPSYFLRQNLSDSIKDSALASVGWEYTEKKRNYRQFCQEMSNRFLQLTPEARLQDTTAGSVRLAMLFLRPWFHRCVVEDFQTATVTLCALSFSIAQWPGQWWALEHSELWNLIRAMVLSIAEEVRATQQGRDSKEISRLQGVIVELDEAVQKYKGEIGARNMRKPAQLLAPLLIPPALRPAVMPNSHSPDVLAPSLGIPASAPRVVITPITPPTSPIHSTIPTFSPEKPDSSPPTPGATRPIVAECDVKPSSPTCSGSLIRPVTPGSPDKSQHLSESISSVDPLFLSLPASPVETPHISPPEAPSPHLPVLSRPSKPLEPAIHFDILLPLPITRQGESLAPTHLSETRSNRAVLRKPPTLAETASCLVTGFLVGAFITLCLLSPQRRTLLTHLT
ncbi:hypothetical protein D9615_003397 [Tricholomella constricta]|uniref:DUF7587 domain-containing protein n=1 Tax=Tricholomella constricta TaxID=117010 RepID=A0A8H5HJB9_9AGAR|nr:hypothetical protein D9615_003397 [Tricholomella constricta]